MGFHPAQELLEVRFFDAPSALSKGQHSGEGLTLDVILGDHLSPQAGLHTEHVRPGLRREPCRWRQRIKVIGGLQRGALDVVVEIVMVAGRHHDVPSRFRRGPPAAALIVPARVNGPLRNTAPAHDAFPAFRGQVCHPLHEPGVKISDLLLLSLAFRALAPVSHLRFVSSDMQNG